MTVTGRHREKPHKGWNIVNKCMPRLREMVRRGNERRGDGVGRAKGKRSRGEKRCRKGGRGEEMRRWEEDRREERGRKRKKTLENTCARTNTHNTRKFAAHTHSHRRMHTPSLLVVLSLAS